MTERLLMIDSAKTVLETIKVTARLSRTEQEAIDFAIDELGKKEDLLETIKDIKDNVYLQGRADTIEELKGRKDEIIRWLIKRDKEGYGTTNGELLDHVLEIAEQLKKQMQKGE